MHTRTSLRICLAIRVEEVFAILDEAGVKPLDGMSCKDVESFLRMHNKSRKSQQYFLSESSSDTMIKRGLGCNLTQRRCFIIDQTTIDEEYLENIKNGTIIITWNDNLIISHTCTCSPISF